MVIGLIRAVRTCIADEGGLGSSRRGGSRSGAEEISGGTKLEEDEGGGDDGGALEVELELGRGGGVELEEEVALPLVLGGGPLRANEKLEVEVFEDAVGEGPVLARKGTRRGEIC